MEKLTLKAIGDLIDKKLDQKLTTRFSAFEKKFEKFEKKIDVKFDQKFAEFEPRFQRIETTLSNVCVIVADLKVTTDEMKVDLAYVKETVGKHTTILDGMAKNYNDFRIEKTVMDYRMGKFENALRYVADETSINIDDKLD